MASQAGPMRLAAWEALRSHSHCMGGGEQRGEGRTGRLALRLLQLWALVEALQGGGKHPQQGSARPDFTHLPECFFE